MSSDRTLFWRGSILLGRVYEGSLRNTPALRYYRAGANTIHELATAISHDRYRRDFLSRKDVQDALARYNRLRDEVDRRTRFDIAALNRSETVSRKMLASLSAIGQKLSSILDLDQLLNSILDLSIDNVHAERGVIYLRNSTEGEMTPVSARGIGKTDLEDISTFSRSVIAHAADGQTVLTVDVGQDPSLSRVKSLILHEIKSILCVPMRAQGEVVGVIYLDTRKNTQLFGEKERTFVESFANQAAIAIENARVFGRMKQENHRLRQAVHARYPRLIGTSPAMRHVTDVIAGIINADCTVLITGESGTGKGLIARTIHDQSTRRAGPFVVVDCGALPENLLEGELFGYRRGAFTGADRDHVGLLEEASGGTLFLDEITNTSIALQARLLRVLQEREVRRLGENSPRHVDVRVIAATNADLPALMSQGRFRQDLYYRLNVVSLEAPPLRSRREDIPLLAASFLERHSRPGRPPLLLGPGVIEALVRYAWPGNVRELENTIERAAILCPRNVITVADLPAELSPERAARAAPAHYDTPSSRGLASHPSASSQGTGGRAPQPVQSPGKTGEQMLIEDALARFSGDKAKAARFIGWNRQKLYRRMKSYAISADYGKAA
jgi:Nif-specific regulatory protein